MQRQSEDIAARSTVDLSHQLRSDIKTLKSRFQKLSDLVSERIVKIEKLIAELKHFENDFAKCWNSLSTIQANLELELQTLSTGKAIEAQLDNLRIFKHDLDSVQSGLNKVNEQSDKFMYSGNADVKFMTKLRNDVNEINEKFNYLKNSIAKKQFNLEVKKKVD